jgi:hypothetical protein
MADEDFRLLNVERFDGTEANEVDRTLCRWFTTARAYSKRDSHSDMSLRAPLNRRVFGLSPGGDWWFEKRDVSAHPDSGLPYTGPIWFYSEVHPIHVARQFIINRQPVPLGLTEYAPLADGPIYFVWLKVFARELSASRGECTTVAVPSNGAILSEKQGNSACSSSIEATDRQFLLALDELKAIDRKHAQKARHALTRAEIPGHEHNQPIQQMIKRLKAASLIDTAKGCGTWLTAKGRGLVTSSSHSSHD